MATRVLRTVLQGVLLAIPLTALLGSFPSSGLSQDRPINIKMASLAPANTVWHDVLMDMGARWREVSGGRVNLQIIPSGQGGEEDDVLRRMRLGQFQAGGFTLAGLQRLSPAVVVLAIPLAIESQAALHRVRAAVGPELEEIFLEKGYVLLHWVDMGWMRFFTKDPDPSPDAIRRYTFVEWAENSSTALWRDAGFRPGARLNIADVTVGLRTGLLDALNTAPLVVYGYQWFTCLDFMIDLRWAPLSGATLIDRRTWEGIPEDLRPELLRIAQETGEKAQASLLQWEEEAIEAMKSHGLQVITPAPQVMEEWRQLFEGSRILLRGDIIPAELYDEAIRVAKNRNGG